MDSLRIIVGLCLLIAVSQAHPQAARNYRGLFDEFKKTYGKAYANEEEHDHRFKVFVENMKRAEGLQERERGTAKYGVTRFSDLSAAEFKKHYLGLNAHMKSNMKTLPQAQIPEIDIPKKFDWRKKKVITEVKDQGQCGSCWAFSTTGNIEALWAIKNKDLISLSEQELVDCDTIDAGCNGGLMTNAYEAIQSLGGLESEADYPYKAYDDKCHFKKSKVVVKITGGVNITSDEKKMAKWLYKNAPLSIGINADNMQLYQSGIAHPSTSDCDPYYLDHGVLIVGYGVQRKTPYWIIKNSWGPSWGEKGYYRVYRGDGTCGLNTMVSSATV